MKRVVILALIASFWLAGCGTRFECNAPQCITVKSGEPITIAVTLTLTGPDSAYGVEAMRGVQLAVEEQGKLLNRDIELLKRDDQCSAEGGKAAAEDIVQHPNVTGVIGASCSEASDAAARVLNEADILMISPSSSASSLTIAKNHQPNFLRTAANDASQAKMVADFIYQGLGARKMATIHVRTSESEALRSDVCEIFVALGGKCVESYVLASGTNPNTELGRVSLFDPEVVYFPVHLTDGVAIAREAKTAGLQNAALIGSDGLLARDFLSQTPGYSDGIYISGPMLAQIDPTFLEKYRSRFNSEPLSTHAAQAYDATMLLFRAITISAKTTGRDIYLMRESIRAVTYATRDYKGVSGTLTCSATGDCAMPNFVIYQVRGLEFQNIYP